MADVSAKLGPMDAVPPALRSRVRAAIERAQADALARLIEDGEPWLGADPALAEVGAWLLDSAALRELGCRWLAMFPTPAVVKRLAEVALAPATAAPVREEAIRALGDREVRARHASTLWSADAIQLADEALLKLADAAMAAGVLTSAALPIALRHVQSDALAGVIARAPGLWGNAIECFATPPLARVLFVSLDEIPAPHRLRTLRLVAATLGEEAVPMLLARASDAAAGERLERLLLAISLGGEVHVGRFEDAVRGEPLAEPLRQRAKWHLAHRGVVPTVRGLRVARVTATLPAADRAAKCAVAADDLGALARFGRHGDAELYAMWAWMVRGSGDRAKTRELVAAHRASQHVVRELYLDDLARRGRVHELSIAAHALDGVDVAALGLAIHGRPLAALELAATARVHTPALVCARALACYRAGRPDLTERILAEDLPPSETVDDQLAAAFPGAHERWMIARGLEPAVAALAGGRRAVIAIAKPAPYDAEPDSGTLAAIAPITRRLARRVTGSTVYLAGDFEPQARGAIAAALERAGARLVRGPAPGTDFYVAGDRCPAELVAQLERRGVRRLRSGELEGS